jgi:hypothetical protein
MERGVSLAKTTRRVRVAAREFVFGPRRDAPRTCAMGARPSGLWQNQFGVELPWTRGRVMAFGIRLMPETSIRRRFAFILLKRSRNTARVCQCSPQTIAQSRKRLRATILPSVRGTGTAVLAGVRQLSRNQRRWCCA